MRHEYRLVFTVAVIATVAACDPSSDEAVVDGHGPHLDGKVIRGGKADGGITLGTATVKGRVSSFYRGEGSPSTCDSGESVDYQISYENHSIPWGASVTLVRAFSGTNNCFGCEPQTSTHFEWVFEEHETMPASAPFVWSAETEHSSTFIPVPDLQFFKFVFRIDMPDGTVRWDNGGSNFGYYRSQVPPPVCDNSWTPFEEHPGSYVNMGTFAVKQ